MAEIEQDDMWSGKQMDKSSPKVDRLARVKDWFEARRAMAADPFGYYFAYRVAIIVRKTYVVSGDAATVSDDIALMMIHDMLLQLDGDMLKRSKREYQQQNTNYPARISKKGSAKKPLRR